MVTTFFNFLNLSNTTGCEHHITFEIEEGLLVEAAFNTEKDTFLFGGETVAVAFENTSLNAETYYWDFGNDQLSTEENPTALYDEEGIYEVSLTATANNCESDYQKIIVIEKDLTSIHEHASDAFRLMQDTEVLTLAIQLDQPERLSISLLNTSGQLVKQLGEQEYLHDLVEVNTSNLASGIYFLRVHYAHGGKNSLVLKVKL